MPRSFALADARAQDDIISLITSRTNSIIKQYKRLAGKLPDRSQRVIIEGIRLVLEALKAKVSFEALFFTSAIQSRNELKPFWDEIKRNVPVCELVSEEIMESLTLEETPSGLWALIQVSPNSEVSSKKSVVVLVGIQDPGNAGTLVRTAEGAGVAVWFSQDSVHRHHPKVVKASMGSAFRVPMNQGPVVPFLQKLKQQGWTLVGTGPSGGIPYFRFEWKLPFALLLGAEARGIPHEIARLTEAQVNIPLEGEVESLNVGVAGAILLFEARRRKKLA